jgi:hypothetical protein
MSSSKEYREISRSSESESPLLEEELSGHVYKRPQSKLRRIARKLIWSVLIHIVIALTYTASISYAIRGWMKGQYCHKPLVYCEYFPCVLNFLMTK